MQVFDFRVIYLDERGCGADHDYISISASSEEEACTQIEAMVKAEAIENNFFDWNWRLL